MNDISILGLFETFASNEILLFHQIIDLLNVSVNTMVIAS